MKPKTYKLFLKDKTFPIPSKFLFLCDLNRTVYDTLITNKQYIICSRVNEKILKSFIEYWGNQKIPFICPENFRQYLSLSNEFGLMKNLIQIYQRQILNANLCSLQTENKKLKSRFSDENDKKETQKRKFHEIIELLFKYQTKNKHFRFKQFEKQLLNSCKIGDTRLITSLLTEKVVIENGIQFLLNEEEKTATVFSYLDTNSIVSIPYSVSYESTEFIVTSIAESAFYDNKKIESINFTENSDLKIINKKSFSCSSLKSILIPSHVTRICELSFSSCYGLEKVVFSKDSELKTIEKDAFCNSAVSTIKIPSSVVELEEGWCNGTTNLKHIIIYHNKAEHISYYESNFIIGKTNKESSKFDILHFSRRDIETANIPSFIKRIDSYAFDKCIGLQKVEFDEDSELESIGDLAFSRTFIERISIPPNVTRIGECCFSSCRLLKCIQFSEHSKLNSIEKATFSCSAIESIIIPSCVTRICQFAFSSCYGLEKVVFSKDSELKTIEKDAFCNSAVSTIKIPSSVVELEEGWCNGTTNLKHIIIYHNKAEHISYYESNFIIGKTNKESSKFDILHFSRRDIETANIPSFIKRIDSYAFEGCQKLKKVEFLNHSELRTIGQFAFSNTSIEKVSIPSSVRQIEGRAFFNSKKLKKVEFDENSKLNFIDSYAFANSSIEFISIPPRVRQINDFAFSCCSILKKVEFCENSELRSIGKAAFYFTLIRCISIPSSVTEIGKLAFCYCGLLQIFEIHEKSKLKFIDKDWFDAISHIHLMIPPNIIIK